MHEQLPTKQDRPPPLKKSNSSKENAHAIIAYSACTIPPLWHFVINFYYCLLKLHCKVVSPQQFTLLILLSHVTHNHICKSMKYSTYLNVYIVTSPGAFYCRKLVVDSVNNRWLYCLVLTYYPSCKQYLIYTTIMINIPGS